MIFCQVMGHWTWWSQLLGLFGTNGNKHLLLWNCWAKFLDIEQEYCPSSDLLVLYQSFRLDGFSPNYGALNLVISATFNPPPFLVVRTIISREIFTSFERWILPLSRKWDPFKILEFPGLMFSWPYWRIWHTWIVCICHGWSPVTT